ncbi:hypothetical protein IWW52_002661, partial [Coemansia sp. RSA 2704]
MWTSQPTRLFAPVIYLHGGRLTLFTFARGACYRSELGQFCHSKSDPKYEDIGRVRDTLFYLFFILSLPPHKFGHFCDVGSVRESCVVRLIHRRDLNGGIDSVLADAVIDDSTDSLSYELDANSHIKRPVNPRGRLAHVFRVNHEGKPAVLKLSWTPTDRMPESAVYDALRAAGIENTPTMVDSGIIVEDLFGYRVEYLVTEDAGVSLSDYLQARKTNGNDWVCDFAKSAMLEVVRCLAQAWAAGILHRDVSSGNVMVKDGRATLIDWGYAKLVDDGPANTDALAAKWGYAKHVVNAAEEAHDPVTGTVLFMSIPVLVGSTNRSVIDDVESMLYVVLDAVSSTFNRANDVVPVALDFKDSRSLAYVRGCCFTEKQLFKQQFGVDRCNEQLERALDEIF